MRPLIRPATPDDYPVLVAIGNRAFPEYPDTVDEWRHWDDHRNPKLRFQRFVAELDGQIVGFGEHSQDEGMYHPRKFSVEITVDPDQRRRGVGGALYDHIARALADADPIAYWTNIREDHAAGLRFAAARGFREVMRNWENHLRMADYAPERFAGAVEKAEATGIAFRTFGELRASDPDFFRKLFAVQEEISQDAPQPDPATPLDFETWRGRTVNNPNLIPDGYFIACDGDRYVGISTLFSSQTENFLYTGWTGVLRAYRRRGIALALKLKALDHARSLGAPLVKTWNASTNVGMLAINADLGFQKQPAWIIHVLDLAAAEPVAAAQPALAAAG
ncbi:GNAT family N-acetyltransferase [bacterium]|nr:MAG: GNAT family N-acetyltransferase [bacterium]